MSINKNNCPVPFDQQPLNEYLSLKESCLFSWSISKTKTFIFGLISIFICILISVNFFLVFFSYKCSIFKMLILNFAISNIVLMLVFIRLYLGWSYVVKRLLSATVFYEESGWYDGQVWVKTSDYLIQDRLVGIYQILPFVLRIKYTFLILGFNFLLSYFFYSHI
uniref:Ycf36 n=1 Tax=Chondria tumulosa TaxID=2740715 RepID=A0A896SV68_9FLOR|nr:hypothetical protein K8K75_pgp082 [Chondria tumulosa]QSD57125.1 hypothetical protein [Chondria tumulosa]